MLSRAAAVESAKQSVKTAIAGLISVYITGLFRLPEGYWAAITALIVMQSNIGATLNASRARLAGTAVGAVVGGSFVAWFSQSFLGRDMLGFALAVAIAFFLCDLLHLADSQRLATVTVAIIMLIGRNSTAWTVALHRFSEVALGIIIALVVSLTLWPTHAHRGLRQGIATALAKYRTFYRTVMRRYRSHTAGPVGIASAETVEPLRAEVSEALRKNADLLKNTLQEPFGPLKPRESLASLARQMERVFTALETVEFAVRESSSDIYLRSIETGLDQLETGIDRALESLSDNISAAGEPVTDWPDLPAILASLDDHAAQARRASASHADALDDVLRFYFLLLSSRNLVQELEAARAIASVATEKAG
ncbi:MAG: FUSC family protein [Bryobacterales bacterium]|nr:FUSC family protein [Bryobacterales bacterium]